MMAKANKKKRSSLSRQVIAMIILAALVVTLVGTLIVVNIVTALRKFSYGGETYYISRQKDEYGGVYYIMIDVNKNPLSTTSDGYFILHDGTLISIDQSTGRANEYIRPDTEGNEQIGINDRVLMFPHTAKDAVPVPVTERQQVRVTRVRTLVQAAVYVPDLKVDRFPFTDVFLKEDSRTDLQKNMLLLT